MNNTSKSATAASPKILPCSCKHDFQDQRHGQSNRVHNPCKRGDATAYRCTVCGNVK